MEEAGSISETPTGLRRVLIVLCATVSTGTYAFTWNAVDVALPQMQGSFSASMDQVTWIYIAFGMGSAMMTGCVGWFSTGAAVTWPWRHCPWRCSSSVTTSRR